MKKELKDFLEFKKTYKFIQKEFEIEERKIYCDGELLKSGNEIISESKKWINAGMNLEGELSKKLSNSYPHQFTFRGNDIYSIESFFQGIKYKDKEMQKYGFAHSKEQIVKEKQITTEYDWRNTGVLYWQGEPINRFNKIYKMLIDEIYVSAIQNIEYRKILKQCDRPIIYSQGAERKEKTTLTRYEFEYEINCLKDFLKKLK